MRRVLPAAGASSGPAKNQLPSCRGRPDSIPGSGCEVQGGRARVAGRELDEPSALRWTAWRKG